jgi:predicted membrane protein
MRQAPQHHFTNGVISPRLVIGLLIIGLGVMALASTLGLMEDHHPMRFFWSLVFLSIGLSLLVDRTDTSRRNWGWIWLGIGAWTFAHQMHWVSVGFWQIVFPIILLFVGARLVTRSMSPPKEGPGDTNQLRIFACMSGHETRSFNNPFKDGEATAILGGVKLDFMQTQMDGDQATLDVTVVMGGIEIYAPPDWNVNIQALPLLGAAIDKRRPSTVVPTKTLTIRGTILMGGLEIKN